MKTYPLTAAQDIILVQQKYSYSKAISNICMMMHFEWEVDDRVMQQALYRAILRNPSASLRITRVAGQVRQYFSGEGPSGIEVVDFREKTQEQAQEEIEGWGRKPFPEKSLDTQLYRVKYVIMPNGERGIYFCVSHLVFDAFSLIATGGDLLEVYEALTEQKPMPKAMPSPLPMYQKEWDYLKSPELEEDRQFWIREFETEPEFHSLNGKPSSEYVKGKRAGTTIRLLQIKGGFINLRIPSDLVKKVEAMTHEHSVPTQSVYLLALRNYLAAIDQSEDISVINTLARRATLAQKKAGGTMVNAMIFRMRIKNERKAIDALKEIADLQVRYYRHGNLPWRDLSEIYHRLFSIKAMEGYACVGLTYQPYMIFHKEKYPVRLERFSNGYHAMGLYLTIMGVDNSGDLLCNYEYTKGYTKPESIHAFHAYLLEMLEKITDDPMICLSDLMKRD